MCAEKFLLVSMGGRAEGLASADPGARTPIGASVFFVFFTASITYLVNSGDAFYLKPCFIKDNVERNQYCFHTNISVICFLQILLLQLFIYIL